MEGMKKNRLRIAMYLLLALSIGILSIKNYQLVSNDLLSIDSDFSSHAIRPYFLLEDYSFTKEWYNGTQLFKYYPPVSVLLDTIVFLLAGNLGLALSISMILLEIGLFAICIKIASLFNREKIGGIFAAAIMLASTISVGRFFNAGRFGEFAGFVMLFLWTLSVISYSKSPSIRGLAFIFIASLLSSLTHFLTTLMQFGFFGLMAAAYFAIKGQKKRAFKNSLLISIAGSAPSIVFWVPFILASNNPKIAETAFSGYIFLIGGLVLLFASGLFIIKYRSYIAIGLAFILLAWGLGKAQYFPPQLGDDFSNLSLDGKYFALREVPSAVYSVLASKGYSSPWGNYDPAASNELIDKFEALEPNCKSIEEFAGYSGSRYVIAEKADLSQCGFERVYSGKLKAYRIG